MADSNHKRSPANTAAGKHFAAAERRDAAFSEQIQRERLERDAKNAKLRVLRLAKEAADREAEAKRIAELPPVAARSRTPRKKPVAIAEKPAKPKTD